MQMESILEDIVIIKNGDKSLHGGLSKSSHSAVDNDTLTITEEHFEMASLEKVSAQSHFCRICHEDAKIRIQFGFCDKLISPCKCTGTLAKIHQSCLEQWLSISNSTKCEICNFEYLTKRVSPNYKDCLMDPKNAFLCRNLVTDILCFSLLTPALIISLYLCFFGATKYYHELSAADQSMGLIAMSVFLVMIYVIWLRVTYKYHCTVWRAWKAAHPKTKLVLTN